VGDLIFFNPRRDSTVAEPRCTCREMTAGVCAVCAAPPLPQVGVQLTINLDQKEMQRILSAEVARIIREFANSESGPVKERLKQIADVVEGAAA
jgi:hypothetical protein